MAELHTTVGCLLGQQSVVDLCLASSAEKPLGVAQARVSAANIFCSVS